MSQDKIKDENSAIDWGLCVKLANNNPEIAKELLIMLINDLPSAQQEILAAFQKKHYSELQAKVHRLHGATCYCGVTNLKNILADLENQLKNNKTDQLEVRIQNLQTEIAKILSTYQTFYA